MTVLDRTLPHNLDAERSVLGAIIVHNEAYDEASELVTPGDFYRDAHARIFSAITRLMARRIAVDFVILKEELARVGELESVGGPSYISELADGMPRSTNVKFYAGIVREKATKRRVIKVANNLLTKAYEDEEDPAALIDMAERGLLDVSEQAVPGDLVPASEIVRSIIPVLERINEAKRAITGLASGFSRLDYYTRGMQPGNLIILGGRTSQGKSSIAAQVAMHVAQTSPVAFFSVEMSQQEHAFRTIGMIAGVDGHLLQTGQLNMFDLERVGPALQAFSDRQFWLDESSTISALQIRSKARRLKAKHGLGLIVVDYLQILQHPRAESQEQRVATTGRMLKAIARELRVPVLALCQLSRAVENRPDQRPRLSDLRESGSLEQDADVVLLLYRPEPKDDGVVTEIKPSELIVSKQRNGPRTSIEMRWIGEQYRFEELP